MIQDAYVWETDQRFRRRLAKDLILALPRCTRIDELNRHQVEERKHTRRCVSLSGTGGYLAGRLRTRWVDVHTDEVYFRDTAHGLSSGALGPSSAQFAELVGVDSRGRCGPDGRDSHTSRRQRGGWAGVAINRPSCRQFDRLFY